MRGERASQPVYLLPLTSYLSRRQRLLRRRRGSLVLLEFPFPLLPLSYLPNDLLELFQRLSSLGRVKEIRPEIHEVIVGPVLVDVARLADEKQLPEAKRAADLSRVRFQVLLFSVFVPLD